MGHMTLPDVQSRTTQDALLRQVPTDETFFRTAIDEVSTALDDARGRNDAEEVVRLSGFLGETYRILGDLEMAEQLVEEALRVASGSEAIRPVVANLIRLGEIYRCDNRFDEATYHLLKAISLPQDPDDDIYRDFALQHLGKVLINDGQFDEACGVLEMALEIRQSRGDDALIASTSDALACARGKRGALTPA